MQRRRVTGTESGFTLIELLIVIAVLGILAGIVLIATGNTKKDAVQSACKTNYKAIQLSAESVYTKGGSYPTTNADLLQSAGKGGVLSEYPTAADYQLTYAGSATSYTITVGGPGGAPTLGTDVAACSSL